VRFHEVFNSVKPIFPRAGRCGFLTAPEIVMELPNLFFNLHETAPTVAVKVEFKH
jgi:hypothetical protein